MRYTVDRIVSTVGSRVVPEITSVDPPVSNVDCSTVVPGTVDVIVFSGIELSTWLFTLLLPDVVVWLGFSSVTCDGEF